MQIARCLVTRRLAGSGAIAVALLAIAMPASAGDRTGHKDHAVADVRTLAHAYNSMGRMLFHDFSEGAGNIVFSPYSIGTAMAMVLAGARGETAREMSAALRHTLTAAQIADANARAGAILRGYDRSHVPPFCPASLQLRGERCEAHPDAKGGCMFPAHLMDSRCVAAPRFPPSARLLVANALMVASAPVAGDYAELLKDRYAAELFRGADLSTLNDWVNRRTAGRIERILDQPSDVLLVNAVYFKSRWATPFDKKLTKDEFFSLSRSRQELVPTMLQRAFHPVVARDGYRAIQLPYAVRELSLVIALPNDVVGLASVSERLDTAELQQLLADLRRAPPELTVLTLPRFRTEYTAPDLKQSFQRAGMTLAFDAGAADFSGLTGVPRASAPTAIDQIVHRAVIEVAEESTEAAAVTAVGIQVASAPARPIREISFRVDRPFLYFLVDERTGVVLFQGRVVDPR